jgi:hypothetical protein
MYIDYQIVSALKLTINILSITKTLTLSREINLINVMWGIVHN